MTIQTQTLGTWLDDNEASDEERRDIADLDISRDDLGQLGFSVDAVNRFGAVRSVFIGERFTTVRRLVAGLRKVVTTYGSYVVESDPTGTRITDQDFEVSVVISDSHRPERVQIRDLVEGNCWDLFERIEDAMGGDLDLTVDLPKRIELLT